MLFFDPTVYILDGAANYKQKKRIIFICFLRLEKDLRFNYFWTRCAKLLSVIFDKGPLIQIHAKRIGFNI